MRTQLFCHGTFLLLLMLAGPAPYLAAQQAANDAGKLAIEAHRLASSAATLQQFTQALRVCQQALRANPSSKTRGYIEKLASWTYNKRGETLIRLAEDTVELDAERATEYEQAANGDFDLAVKLDESNWKPRYNRAVCVAIVGDYEQALADLKIVIEEKPKHKNARFNRAEILFGMGRIEEAVKDYDVVIQQDPRDLPALSGRGLALLELGEFEDALLDLNKVVRLDSENAEAYVDRADIYATMGNWERAAGDYRVAIGLNDQLPRAYHNVAWLMATCPDKRFRNAPLAVRAAKKTIQLERTNYRNLDTLAAALASTGDFQRATTTLQQAMATAPTEELAGLRERLTLYENRKPYRDADPSQVRLATHEETVESTP